MRNGIHSHNGFTLIELMIVIAIVAILVALAVPAYQDYTIRAKVTECISAAAVPKLQISEFRQVENRWPNSNQEAGISHDFSLLFGDGLSSYCSMFLYLGGNGRFYIIADAGSLSSSLGLLTISPLMTPTVNSSGSVGWECSRGITSLTALKYLPSTCRDNNN